MAALDALIGGALLWVCGGGGLGPATDCASGVGVTTGGEFGSIGGSLP